MQRTSTMDLRAAIRRRLAGVFGMLCVVMLAAMAPFAASDQAEARSEARPAAGNQAAINAFKHGWQTYRTRFVSFDGRVRDTGNNGISHTESQATGMLFAVYAGDRDSFDRIWRWTDATLRRPDGLYSWKFDPAGAQMIPDPNNASDGELMLAWALLLAEQAWGDPAYIEAADAIAAAVEVNLIESFGGLTVLLPGLEGFSLIDSRVLNPSYCVFPALREIAAHRGHMVWIGLYNDCLSLVRSSSFGADNLPLDWVELTNAGTVRPAPERETRFGYDAIRVPLYLAWGGHTGAQDLGRFATAWALRGSGETPPSWINPFTGEIPDYTASHGFLAVRRLVDAALATRDRTGSGTVPFVLPSLNEDQDYYASSLLLFSLLAALDLAGTSTVPL